MAERRHAIVHQVWIEKLSVFINHFFKQAMAYGVHDTAFVLALAEDRMDGLADVRQRHISNELNFAGVAINLNFRSAPRDLPKGRRRTQGGPFTLDVLVDATTDDFTGLGKENFVHERFKGNALPFAAFDSPLLQG